jgi:DNA-binding PadR family transcriptional regulator
MWPFRFAMRRKRGLPNMVVYLLSSSPKNGVELMDGIESITRGWWRPTPGSIYPLLKEMAEQGIVKKMDDGRYELTSKGRAQAEVPFGGRAHRAPTTDEMVDQMNSLVSYMEDVKSGNREKLGKHNGTLRDLSKRLADLAGEDKSDTSE